VSPLKIVVLLLLLFAVPAHAQETPPLKVGVSSFEPLVFLKAGTKPSGFSVSLWDALAREMGRKYEFVQYVGVKDKLQALKDNEVDVAIGGITVTQDREAKFNFSHPTFHTGLDILVPTEGGQIWGILQSLFTWDKMTIILGFFLFLVLVSHLMWYVERGLPSFPDDYRNGIFVGIYWAIVTTSSTGYGDFTPKTKLGKIIAMLTIVLAMPAFGVFTAVVTSSITVQRLQGSINGPSDLADKRVGVIKGSASADVVREYGATPVPYPSITSAKKALLQRKIKAVVYDAPNLRHLVRKDQTGRLTVVGKLFKKQRYAIALPASSHLQERVDRALLALMENGEFTRLEERWFGTE